MEGPSNNIATSKNSNVALHKVKPGFIPSILYGPPSPPELISEHRSRNNIWTYRKTEEANKIK